MARILVRDDNGNTIGVHDIGDTPDGRIFDAVVQQSPTDPDLLVVTLALTEGEE